jgi:hypothetical protein
MSSLAVVTTFPPNRWTAYARRMLQSHIDFWPDDVMIHAYHEGNRPNLDHEKINYPDFCEKKYLPIFNIWENSNYLEILVI